METNTKFSPVLVATVNQSPCFGPIDRLSVFFVTTRKMFCLLRESNGDETYTYFDTLDQVKESLSHTGIELDLKGKL